MDLSPTPKVISSEKQNSTLFLAIAFGQHGRSTRGLARKSLLLSSISLAILYIEFGVWKGHSIKYFADKYKSASSEFYGFDTFYGFPEKCLSMEKGHYSTAGEMPQLNDVRIKFIKGLFQETLPIFLKKINFETKKKTVLVHFDAPLHSATLFTLFKLSEKFTNYYFIFDQLGTEECRALNNFNESTLSDYDLYFASLWNRAPEVVFGKLKS